MSEEIKCSKNNPCQPCKDELQEKLKDCKDWEIKRKEYIKSWFPFHDEEENKIKYSETGGYNICSCRFEISNSHGDINPNNHNCSDNKDNIERERERERDDFSSDSNSSNSETDNINSPPEVKRRKNWSSSTVTHSDTKETNDIYDQIDTSNQKERMNSASSEKGKQKSTNFSSESQSESESEEEFFNARENQPRAKAKKFVKKLSFAPNTNPEKKIV